MFIRPLDNGNVLVADNKMTVESLKKLSSDYEKYIKEHNLTETEKDAYKNILEQIDLYLKKFEITENFDPYNTRETTEKIVESLRAHGFNPIKVPANYYYLDKIRLEEDVHAQVETFEKDMKDLEAKWSRVSEKAAILVKNYTDMQRMLFLSSTDKLGVRLVKFYNNNFVNSLVYKNKAGETVYITNAALLDRDLGITPEIEAKTGLSTKNIFINSISPYVKPENIHFIPAKLTEKLFKLLGGIHCTTAEIPG